MANPVTEFHDATVFTKANVYFDGKVVSHTLLFRDGSRKTLGLIYPGKFHFNTDAAERMEIVAGACDVQVDDESAVKTHTAGATFQVPAKSGFTIGVTGGVCEYICSFLR